jgi:hypothetical protein
LNGQPSGAGKFTRGQIRNENDSLSGPLQLDFNQYHGELPYDGTNYEMTGTTTINTVFALAVVPEPGTGILIALGGVGFAVVRFRIRPGNQTRARTWSWDSEKKGKFCRYGV